MLSIVSNMIINIHNITIMDEPHREHNDIIRTIFGHEIVTRDDNNEGVISYNHTDNDTKYGIIINHNHYIDGCNMHERNFEVTLYVKEGDTYEKMDCEMDMTMSAKYLYDKQKKSRIDIVSFVYNILTGNFDDKLVSTYVDLHELVSVYNQSNSIIEHLHTAHKSAWYDGCSPELWIGLVKLHNSVYYMTKKVD